MAIELKLNEGFEKLLQDIEKAGEDAEKACDSAMRQSAQIMQSALKTEMANANVPSRLIDAMPPFEVEQSGNTFRARVGYKKGSYDPDNLSDGYKVVFLNYGTPQRSRHGKIQEGGKINLGFIQRAKATAKPKIRKAQKEEFQKILERLKE